MLWEFFAILTAAVWAVTNILDKYALTKLVKSPVLNYLSQIIIVFFAILIAIFHGLGNLSIFNITLALIAGMLESFSIFLYFYAAKLDEISRVLPMWYFDTVFIAILALFFLGELFSLSTYFGIALLLIGVVLIGVRKLKQPKVSRAMFIMLAASFLIAVSAVIVKYLLGFSDYLTVLVYLLLGYSILVIPLLIKNLGRVEKLLAKNRKGVGILITKEMLTVAGTFSYVFAASIGPITLVNAFSSLQPLFVLILAVATSLVYPKLFYEELKGSNIALKLVAILLIIVGTYLIAL